MFDLDTFLGDCTAARAESEPIRAVKEVLARAVAEPAAVAAALPPERAEIVRLLVTPELTVAKVVWAPGMHFRPHDHRVWAAIGIYTGGEDNAFYRRAPAADGHGDGLVESGGRQLRPRDVCLLGDDAVHAVTNPTTELAGAIHVYGGDFFNAPRSEWDETTFEERPYDAAAVLAYFEAQNHPAQDPLGGGSDR